jgi:L-asparaginase
MSGLGRLFHRSLVRVVPYHGLGQPTTVVAASSSAESSHFATHRRAVGTFFKPRFLVDHAAFTTASTNHVVSKRVAVGQKSIQAPAGCLWNNEASSSSYRGSDGTSTDGFIPQVEQPILAELDNNNDRFTNIRQQQHNGRFHRKKRVLVLCTGGTLCMAPDAVTGALTPVQGAITSYVERMQQPQNELQAATMPDVVLHEYVPFLDSSDLGPNEFINIATDIRSNYLHFDGFVVLTGTDTMAYCATALSFLLENLAKPVVFTGSQVPLCEPNTDGRHNLIMALVFASRGTINEVTIFFHDRLLRANRATKVNTHQLLAFDSPNIEPLATTGVSIRENEALFLSPAKGALRVHTQMDTRLLTIRLVPGFDDAMIADIIYRTKNAQHDDDDDNDSNVLLKALVLQLYGTGNLPSVKESFVQLLADARQRGILVVAATQCHTGSVILGHYAVGRALIDAGVVSAGDMTIEATVCKVAYLLGRRRQGQHNGRGGDNALSLDQVAELMSVPLRGEITPPPTLRHGL